MITPEVQEQTIRCMNELARIETNDILAYIKAQLPITGITVHEGKNICVRWDGTNDLILYCTIPGDTDDELIEKAAEKLDELLEVYLSENKANESAIDYSDAVWNAFPAVGLRPVITAADRTIYV